ncbi:MAG TPA: serine--tRNA ligase, partial [Candidatus Bipolaricaulota bacterium]
FPLYKGWGARLEIGLIQFFWNFHVKTGYTHLFPPFLGNALSMYTASQLPKFKDDVYYIEKDDLYLNPTSETLICNLHRDEILEKSQLPLKYAAYTACFRREAGAAGEEERGLIRMHQFNKVELFKFTDAQSSFEELEGIVRDAEGVLQALDLHYRLVLLPTGDMAGQSAKTYDIEMWIPSQNRYYEVSSCSNCTDYQARRGNIRYRPEPGARPQFVHTLNGSGLASSRLFAAIVETYQRPDGSIAIPKALQPYVGADVIKES